MSVSLLRLPEVKKQTGLSRSAIYALIATGDFPKQVKLSSRASAWVESEITQWIDDRISERDNEVAA